MKKYRIKLRELLAERNVTITQVHNETGLSRPTLNSIFNDRNKGIQLETIDILCNYLRITPGELFAEIQPIKPVYPQRKKAAIKK